MPSTALKKLKTSSDQSSTEVLHSLNSTRLPRRCLDMPSTTIPTTSTLQSSLPSLNQLLTNNKLTNLLLKELVNSLKPSERTFQTDGKLMVMTTLRLLLHSTNKLKPSRRTSKDLKIKPIDLNTRLITSTNVLVLNPLLPKLPVTSSKETNNFGTKLQLFAQPSITNTDMPQHQEDKNSNSFLNLKPLLKEDSPKLLTKVLKSRLTSEEIDEKFYFSFFFSFYKQKKFNN